MNNKNNKNIVAFKFMLLLFTSILISTFFVGSISLLIIKNFDLERKYGFFPLFFIGIPLIASGVITLLFSLLASRKRLDELNVFLNAIDRVSKGDFSIILDEENAKAMKPIYNSFNSMVRELNSIDILRNDFISSFSHEFKTPIVSIRGFAKILKENSLPQDKKNEYVNIIIEEIDRLVSLADQTLLLTKLESKEYVLEKETFRLDEQIRKSILLLQNDWERKNINLNVNLETVYITNSKDLLNQLWINILSNSIKYNDYGGKINISLKAQDKDMVTIEIEDSGIGMSEDTIKYIYNKFYQEDKSRKTDGIGLGLSIVKRIIDLCNGLIDVTSHEMKGTIFSIKLPKSI